MGRELNTAYPIRRGATRASPSKAFDIGPVRAWRDRAVPEGGRGLQGYAAEGRDPLRRTGLGARPGRAAPPAIYAAGVPILGICYGEQAMAQQLGGMA